MRNSDRLVRQLLDAVEKGKDIQLTIETKPNDADTLQVMLDVRHTQGMESKRSVYTCCKSDLYTKHESPSEEFSFHTERSLHRALMLLKGN